MKNSDMPAMPTEFNGFGQYAPEAHAGLTKREMFAMAAMQGLCAHDGPINSTLDCQAAVSYADELLAELEKTK